MEKKTAYIGLGSNLGNRHEMIEQAVDMLGQPPGIHVVTLSQLIETPPVGGPAGQENYLNGIAELLCAISSRDLFERLMSIEKKLGRTRTVKWAPRTIDLDLLMYGSEVINQDDLQVPHPLMHERHFVMSGMNELAPDLVHPVLHRTMRDIFESLPKSS
ncbi:MAG: 2-amino-4-hydroxy-6-hydroxymethyldihydropteridine diphosphokinase [Sedimentisphaerales bacterium]|nr:2-amino-4-hydroxy-6-hydroxymethyldihydropteridine diphosphokinase [Sedimentisphaerales bacterium]